MRFIFLSIFSLMLYVTGFSFLFGQKPNDQQLQKIIQDVSPDINLAPGDVKNLINDFNTKESNPTSLDLEINNKINDQESVGRDIQKVNESNTSNNDISLKDNGDTGKEISMDKEDINSNNNTTILLNQSSDKKKSQYFGYSTFLTNPEIFDNTVDFAVPPNYLIGPGDEIVIMLWGQTEDITNYFVSKDGYIFVKNIGQVFVNGLTLEKLEVKLKKIFKKSYSSISPDGSMSPTFFDISLGSIVLKPIRVFVMGEVENPGAYEMKPSSTIFSSLYYFNGPKVSGTLRDIHLIRDGKKIGSIDFYDFLIKGKKIMILSYRMAMWSMYH